MIQPGQMINLYNSMGIRASTHFADATYAVPSIDYLTDQFTFWWRKKLEERGLGKWETVWDCDDFAWTFYTDIRWAHYNSKKSNAEGISVGVVYYMSGAREEDGSGGGHAINTAIVGADNERSVVFLEPQRAARGMDPIITLTDNEIASIWFLNY